MLLEISLPDGTAKPLQTKLANLVKHLAYEPELLDYIEDQLFDDLSWAKPAIEAGLASPKISAAQAQQQLTQTRQAWLDKTGA